jgi:dTDP-4-amino-4,6-dideoxygalactose transaminase
MIIRWLQPSLGSDELRAVAEVFADSWPGAGPRVKAFTRAFADHLEVIPEQLIAITSCTEGLFQVIEALDLKPGDEVVMPTISYVGAAHAVLAARGRVRLTDVDPVTLNPTTEQVRQCITTRTRAIIVMHYGGRRGWIEEIPRSPTRVAFY